jgi:hypothetical protein
VESPEVRERDVNNVTESSIKTIRNGVNAVQHRNETRRESRKCYNCGKAWHLANVCRKKKKKEEGGNKGSKSFILPMNDSYAEYEPGRITFILDSVCARNLTGNASLLNEVEESRVVLMLPDGTKMNSTKKGSVNMNVELKIKKSI